MALSENIKKLTISLHSIFSHAKKKFVKKSEISDKKEINLHTFRNLGIAFFFIFIATVMLMPDEQPVEFTQKLSREEETKEDATNENDVNTSHSAQNLWSSPPIRMRGNPSLENEPNYNTSMVLGSKNGNAKTQIRAGQRLALRFLDKFIVSEEPVPVLAELILNTVTDSGLRLPAGARFYGEASFQKGSQRASVRFSQISLPNGQIRPISAIALGKDGQTGVPGRVHSDGMKNTTGQIITTFIGGLAAGSMETDILGSSKGGIKNGLYAAISETAKDRARDYGEKLKTQREWIEIRANAECDAILNEALNLQEGGE